jgi:hypothetical protein
VPNPSGDSGVPNPSGDSGVPNPDLGVQDTGVADVGMPPTGDMFNPTGIAGEYASAVCAFRARCEPVYQGFLREDEAQCRTSVTEALMTTYPAYLEAITGGRAIFRRAGFDACVAAYNNADCITAVAPDACDGMFVGQRTTGQACALSIECSTDSWCNIMALGGCGTCIDRAGVNENCAQNVCDVGTDCFNVGQMAPDFRCAPINAQENQTCGTIQTGLCQGHLQCVGTMSGSCQRPAGAGQPCNPDPQSSATVTCNIYQNQVCVTPGNTCQTASWVGPGQMCNQTALCDSDSVEAVGCGAGGTCTALPGAGLACAGAACAEGAFCDMPMGGTCQMVVPSGQACTSSTECGNLYCVNNTCGPLDWTQCN